MKTELNWNLLPTFIAFVDSGCSIKRCASALFLSEPAVHNQLAKLSEQLQQPLYERHGRTLLLTSYGEDLARFARDIESKTQQFLQPHAQKMPTIAAGVGAWEVLLCHQLIEPFPIPLIAKGDDCFNAVKDGRALLGLSAKPVVAGLMSELFLTSGLCLVGHNQQQLHERVWILPSRQKPHRERIERWFQANAITVKSRIEVDEWNLMIKFAQQGLGLAIVNEHMIPTDVAKAQLPDWPTIRYRWAWLEQNNTLAQEWIRKFSA